MDDNTSFSQTPFLCAGAPFMRLTIELADLQLGHQRVFMVSSPPCWIRTPHSGNRRACHRATSRAFFQGRLLLTQAYQCARFVLTFHVGTHGSPDLLLSVLGLFQEFAGVIILAYLRGLPRVSKGPAGSLDHCHSVFRRKRLGRDIRMQPGCCILGSYHSRSQMR